MSIYTVSLTREDTATDRDISSEGAFLVNVSAVNSLLEIRQYFITLTTYLDVKVISKLLTASVLPKGSVVRTLQAWKTIVR